jgi:hypothetical protein
MRKFRPGKREDIVYSKSMLLTLDFYTVEANVLIDHKGRFQMPFIEVRSTHEYNGVVRVNYYDSEEWIIELSNHETDCFDDIAVFSTDDDLNKAMIKIAKKMVEYKWVKS